MITYTHPGTGNLPTNALVVGLQQEHKIIIIRTWGDPALWKHFSLNIKWSSWTEQFRTLWRENGPNECFVQTHKLTRHTLDMTTVATVVSRLLVCCPLSGLYKKYLQCHMTIVGTCTCVLYMLIIIQVHVCSLIPRLPLSQCWQHIGKEKDSLVPTSCTWYRTSTALHTTTHSCWGRLHGQNQPRSNCKNLVKNYCTMIATSKKGSRRYMHMEG